MAETKNEQCRTDVNSHDYVDSKKMCEILGISRRTLFRWLRMDRLPFRPAMYINGYVWNKSDIITYMKQQESAHE